MITEIDKNVALLLIDLQKGIVEKATTHPVLDVLKQASLLIKAFRKRKLPIVALNVNPAGAAWTKTRKEAISAPQNFQTRDKIYPTTFTELVPELPILSEDLHITKKTWNAFFQTPLQEELQKRNITQIILCGISTSIGVEGTARAASELGYNIIFATEAMADTILEAHNNSILNIFPRLGERGTTNEIINHLKFL